MHVSGPAEQTCKEELHYILNPSAQQLAFEQVALAAQLQPAGVVDQAPNKKGRRRNIKAALLTNHRKLLNQRLLSLSVKTRGGRRGRSTLEDLEQQQPEAAGTATQLAASSAASPHYAAESAKTRKKLRDTSGKQLHALLAHWTMRDSQPRRARGRRTHLLSQVLALEGCTCAGSAI